MSATFVQQWKFPQVQAFIHSSNKYFWNPPMEGHSKKVLQLIQRLLLTKNVCLPYGVRDTRGVSKGPQGDVRCTGKCRWSPELGGQRAVLRSRLSLQQWTLGSCLYFLSRSNFAFRMWTHHHSVHRRGHSVPGASPAVYQCCLTKFSLQCCKALGNQCYLSPLVLIYIFT